MYFIVSIFDGTEKFTDETRVVIPFIFFFVPIGIVVHRISDYFLVNDVYFIITYY